MAVSALAAMMSGSTLPLMNVVFGALVGDFTGYFLPNTTVTQAQFQAALNRNALYIFCLFIARFFLTYINKFGFRMIGIRMSAAIRLHYLRSLFSQPIHVLDSMPPGSAAGTITTTANVMQLGISEKLGTFLEFLSTIITAIAIAFSYSWKLTLVNFSLIVFIGLSISALLPYIIKGTSRATKAETRSTSVASEAFSAIRMVTACGAEAQMAKRFSVWADAARRHGLATSPLMATQFGLIFFSIYAAFALAFWFGGHNIQNSQIILVVLMSVMMMVMSLERMSTPLIAVGKAMVAACEFFIIIDAPTPNYGNLKGPEVSADHDIIFKGVDFAYPSRPHVKVLDSLDLTIQAGKLTAIVGPSGSGKSTIVGLIERWYTLQDQHVIAKAIDPEKKKKAAEKKKKQEKAAKKNGGVVESGSDDEEENVEQPGDTGVPIELKGLIQSGEHDLNAMDLRWWRTQIGLVQQEPFLFNDTIYKNVAYGLLGSEFENESEERKKELVREACKESFADEFIDRLPDGYETFVGDSGTKLSGGQRQRISIARAVIKKPKILILDEATSAIDVRGEKIVQAALDKVSQGRTTITIAHRLSTIRKADTIVVLKKGKVVEQGTHESLLEDDKGVYYGLVHAQHLSLGEPTDASDVETTEEEDLDAMLVREKSAALSDNGAVVGQAQGWKRKGVVQSFGRLLWEQKKRFPSYSVMIVAAACAGAVSPMQAYLFAKILNVFILPIGSPEYNRDIDFWAGMWAVLALTNGFSYFTLGFLSTRISHVSLTCHVLCCKNIY